MAENKQLKLVKRPIGLPTEDCWSLESNSTPTLQDGQFLAKVEYVSLDPAMRGWMNDSKSYIAPVKLGAVMRAGTIAKVVESKHDKFQVGAYVTGSMGVQQYAVSDGTHCIKTETFGLPPEKFLSVLGMPGITAYFGFLEIGQPKEGETVVVSGAAGAVGSVVGQIAKIKGCRAVGIAGGPGKCAYVVNELGFDACIDYKNSEVRVGLKEHCPNGIDVYFDNVGGEILDTVLTRINRGARIPICGAISQYNNKTAIKGPSNYLSLLVNRARMQGFVVFDWADRYAEAVMQMGQWIQEGKLKSREHIETGIENFYPTFCKLFNGEKKGKLVLKV